VGCLRAIFEAGFALFWGYSPCKSPKNRKNALQNFGFFWYFFFHKKKYKEQGRSLLRGGKPNNVKYFFI